MAIHQHRGKWQVRLENKLLPRKHFATFLTKSEAEKYQAYMLSFLERGVVPLDLVEPTDKRSGHKISTLIENFRLSSPGPAKSDLATLARIHEEVGQVTVDKINAAWADIWVSRLKVELQLAPGSIRKRVESLARVIDWHNRKTTPADQSAPVNALRVMPRGYSVYSAKEAAALVENGKQPKKDTKRDRRLAPGEEQKIRDALAGIKAADRQRTLAIDENLTLLFDLILNTGLRLREAYWLRCEEFDQGRGLLHVRGTKGHGGVIKPRLVPVVPVLRDKLRARCAGKKGLLFPFWDGDPENLSRVTSALSSRFKTLFNYAGLPDFTEHDLRHEATCRWATMRNKADNGWMWSELEICKIMGWTKTDMFLRYASLRGEDLSDRFF
jgi:integrase